MRLGFDLDGVLANFCDDFHKVLTEVTGRHVPFPQGGPTVWDWPQEDLGYTNLEVGQAWKRVLAPGSTFWLDHPVLNRDDMDLVADLTDIDGSHAVYFITDRGGEIAYSRAKDQTELWLTRQGVYTPTVLIGQEKHLLAKGLKLDLMIDDRPENLLNIEEPTRRYMLGAAYNRWAWGDSRLIVVSSVREMLAMEKLI